MLTYRSELLACAFLLGLALRLIALPQPGTTDAPIFALWADTAAAEGVGPIYGTGGPFPERRLLERDGVRTKVNYPPLLLDAFSAARALRLPLKALSVAADVLLTVLLWLTARARAPALGPAFALAPALAYWLNPATIITGSVLGYVEPLLALPATAAIVAAASGWAALAGALMAAAVMTKQNALLALPATLLALGAAEQPSPRRVRARRAAAGALITLTVATAPVVWAGGALNMAWSLAAPLRDPFLSGNAANVWWLIGKAAPHAPVDLCRVAGAAAVITVMVWTIVLARRRADGWLCSAAAALSFHAYHVLAVSAHEPHLFPAVALLALAAAGRPRFWLPLAAVSAIAALNVELFYGLGMNAPHLTPRAIGGVETASCLAVANCAALAWHARVFAREARRPAPPERP